MKEIWPFFGIVAKTGLAAAVFVSMIVLPLEAHAARTVTSATLNGASSVTVIPGAAITAVVNVTTTGTGAASRWYSTGWRIATTAPGAVTCVDHTNHSGAGAYSETFSISAPVTPGTYDAYFIAYNNDTCTSGASATLTMASAVTVTQNPVPTTTSISPASKNLGAATFTMTVNGANFVPGSVVRFAGSDRTTAYVSTTQLTATIPASDLTTLGTFNITVFNPAPGGGTSNAQTFTVNPAPPAATTNPASGVTAAVATLNGTVSSNGANTTVTFEFGLTAAYGETIIATQSPLAVNAVNAAVSADVIGLNCSTVFHYRVVATNSAGTTNGLDGTFTTGACTAPFPATACAATRFNGDLGCTANDVSLTNITLAPNSISSCVSGTPVVLNLDLTVNFSSPNRYDVGIFIANDGKLPTLLPANGGASSCSVDVLPITTPPFGYTFPDLDGAPQGTSDTCGDGNSSINAGTGSGVKRMTGVTLPCYASPASGGKLFVPFAVSWDNQKSPIGNLCTSNLYPVPNTTSKCNAPSSAVSVNVVVLPVITKSNGGTTINPGANTTYTVVITNNSGGTLQNAVFTDPAVTNLTVNSVSCAAAGGAACPTMTSSAMITAMQDITPVTGGILIPSADLPNDSSLTFTIDATLSSGAPVGSHLINTANITVGGFTASDVDDDLIVIAPSAAKSFTPSTITEGAASLLTVTLANPTVSAVTGVSFTDTYPAGMVNTASANGATTCGGTVTAANNGNSVALSGGTIQAGSSCTVTVSVTSAIAGSYTNSTGDVTTDIGTIPAASAPLTVNVAVYGAFNACDVGTTCTNTTTVTDSHIATKIAGSPFSLDIVALKTDGSRNTSYNSMVSVELLNSSDNSGALDSYNCRSTWTVMATLSPNPAFAPANNGLITVGPFSVPNAYRNVRVRVTNIGGSTKRGCSTDNFSIRPTAFSVTSSNATQTGSSGTPAIKTGANFNLTAASVAGYDGAPGIDNTKVVGTPTAGTIGGSFSAAPAGTGTATGNSFIYSEVGNFGLNANAVYDSSFTGVDQPSDCTSDFSNSLVGGKYGCSFGSAPIAQTLGVSGFGRFIPDHFALAGMPIVNRILSGCAPDSSFTYAGEEFQATFTLEARNAANIPTANYLTTNGYAKLDGTVPANFNFGAVDLADAVPPLTATPSMGLTPVTSSGSWTAGGQGTFNVNLMVNRATAPDGPFESFNLGVDPIDTDGVKLASYNLDVNNDTTNDHGLVGASKIRYGQMKLFNVYGSELLNLTIPMEVQYWNGSAFVKNGEDSCTQIDAANIGLANYTKNLAPGETVASTGVAFNAGVGSLTLSKPGATNNGSVDLVINLGATATETPCITLTPDPVTGGANLSYLQGKWCDAAYDKDPTARATFGVYKGRNEFIYLRESY